MEALKGGPQAHPLSAGRRWLGWLGGALAHPAVEGEAQPAAEDEAHPATEGKAQLAFGAEAQLAAPLAPSWTGRWLGGALAHLAVEGEAQPAADGEAQLADVDETQPAFEDEAHPAVDGKAHLAAGAETQVAAPLALSWTGQRIRIPQRPESTDGGNLGGMTHPQAAHKIWKDPHSNGPLLACQKKDGMSLWKPASSR
jgi:hypothetical protein